MRRSTTKERLDGTCLRVRAKDGNGAPSRVSDEARWVARWRLGFGQRSAGTEEAKRRTVCSSLSRASVLGATNRELAAVPGASPG